MSDSPYVIRNYQPEDFDNYVRLNIEANRQEMTGRCISPHVLAENLARPNYAPEQDLFVVEAGGDIAGFMNITPNLKISRVILDCFIHPDHRNRGLAKRLLGSAMQRAGELKAKVAHVNVLRDDSLAGSVLPGLGFQIVRRFLELSLDIAGARWQDIDLSGLQYRHLQRGEEDKLARIQNRSFADTWGYNPNTVEEIAYWTNLSGCSPGDVILACDGDSPVGYCWTRTGCRAEGHVSENEGRIYMLGVDPDYRGRGVGRGVLIAGLSYLRSRNVPVVELTVDSENQAACALYRSAGFRVRTSSLWYERAVG